jgi:hypothetical protein
MVELFSIDLRRDSNRFKMNDEAAQQFLLCGLAVTPILPAGYLDAAASLRISSAIVRTRA